MNSSLELMFCNGSAALFELAATGANSSAVMPMRSSPRSGISR